MAIQQISPTTIGTDETIRTVEDDDRQWAVAARAYQLAEQWNRFSEIVEPARTGDDADSPASEASDTAPAGGWRKGIDPDRRLGPALEAALGDTATVLHARKPAKGRSDIDHLIVAASGVWIVNTKSDHGRVERRDLGTWRTADLRLYIDGRDQTKILERFVPQKHAVRAALDPTGIVGVPIHSVLLFTDRDPKGSNAAIDIRGVRAVWARKLIELVTEPGPLDLAAREAIVTQLGTTLKARRGTRRSDR